MAKRPRPQGKCDAKGCSYDAKYWCGETNLKYCGRRECAKKLYHYIQKITEPNEMRNENFEYNKDKITQIEIELNYQTYRRKQQSKNK